MNAQSPDKEFLQSLRIEPLNKNNWNKFTQLFGENGACSNCWCMYYRLSKAGFAEGKVDDGNKDTMKALVWSIPCTFIDKRFRRQGVSVALLEGVIKYAKEHGIAIIEAYPTIPTREKLPDAFAWIGLYKSFERAGFEIVDTTSKNRPMVRYYVKY
jgi:GNAT superfamily N-acetyltransferase